MKINDCYSPFLSDEIIKIPYNMHFEENKKKIFSFVTHSTYLNIKIIFFSMQIKVFLHDKLPLKITVYDAQRNLRAVSNIEV